MRFRLLLASGALALSACAGTSFEWDNARKIDIGMTDKQVTALMGEPSVSRSTADGITWVWVFANGFTGQSRSVSVVFKDGKVTAKPPIPDSYK